MKNKSIIHTNESIKELVERYNKEPSKELGLEISNADVSSVTYISYLFIDSKYNQPLNNWDVSNVIDMEWVFFNSEYNQPLDNWDVSKVYSMDHMFYRSIAFNQPLDNWDVSKVNSMNFMFSYSVFAQSISSWVLPDIMNRLDMFKGSINDPTAKLYRKAL